VKPIAAIAYVRDGKPDDMKWKHLGVLFDTSDGPRILLRGFRFGLCAAKPLPGQDHHPYIQGDIYCNVAADAVARKLFVGFICTSETGGGDVLYSVTLEAMPLVPAQSPSGIWLDIEPDDRGAYVPIQ
jgi:hypothetical protein